MNLISLDFETFYSQQYSLSKITTEEYIRHEEFEVIGVGVAVNDDEPVWYSGPMPLIRTFLGQFDWDNAILLAHNAMFDAAIASWHFGIKPKRIADTLSMARALHGTEVSGSLKALAIHYGIGEKGDEVVNALGKRRVHFTPAELARYGEYCKNDVALCRSLFETMAPQFSVSELRLIDLTIRMFSEPVLELDPAALDRHMRDILVKKSSLMEAISAEKADLMSNPKFADILRGVGVEPPTKTSPTTGKETYAFSKSDEAFVALQEHENPLVQALVAARLGVKSTLEETRTQRFIDISKRGTLPIPLRYYAAHTGRWGGDDKVNMQNLPRTSPLKYAIKAPAGYVMVDSDSSQIEARTLAWLAEQNDLVEAFEKGEDVYKIMASSIYNKHIDDITKAERFVGKSVVLGAGYGLGPKRFQVQLKNFGVNLPAEECERIIHVYRSTYPRIPELWKQAGQALEAMIRGQTAPIGRDGVISVTERGILLPNGLHIKYPGLRKSRDEGGKIELVYDTKKGKTVIPNRIYSAKCIENLCQALARIVVGEQMLLISRKYKVVMTVHDAVACIVPEHEAERAQEYVELCMRLRPSWAPDLPLNCEAGYGPSYGEC
jgi:DNA polymerase